MANAVKLCGTICTSVEDIEKPKDTRNEKELNQSMITQIKYWKTVSKGGIKRELFCLTKKGKKLSETELEENSTEIVTQVMTGPTSDAGASSSMHDLMPEEKELQCNELKEKFLAKIVQSPSKKRGRGPWCDCLLLVLL